MNMGGSPNSVSPLPMVIAHGDYAMFDRRPAGIAASSRLTITSASHP
jgi:hypothetical protein